MPRRASLIDWYNRPAIANFGRLAIDPSLQGCGYASMIMDYIESRARDLGYAELALDTSVKATHLLALYSKRSYRLVGHHQWSDKSYVA